MGSSESSPKAGREAPRGLYMYGGVGVGKTMLMDLLVAAAPPEFQVCPTSLFLAPFTSAQIYVDTTIESTSGSCAMQLCRVRHHGVISLAMSSFRWCIQHP